jgi:malate dehydrogenase
LKNQLPAGSHLALYDVAPVVPGVAVDLSHIPTPVKVTGHAADDLEAAVADADIIVIPAGVPRKPGMTRDDLFNVNAGIVQKLVETGAKAAPNACYAIITNPVNSTVPIAAETLKKAGVYDPRRVFGVTMLDVIRSNTFVGELKGINPDHRDRRPLGQHHPAAALPAAGGVLRRRARRAGAEDPERRHRGGRGEGGWRLGDAIDGRCRRALHAGAGARPRG